MLPGKKLLLALTAAICTVTVFFACKSSKPQAAATVATPLATPQPRVLVFAKTKGYHHESIADGLIAIQKLGTKTNFLVDTTTNSGYFTEDSL